MNYIYIMYLMPLLLFSCQEENKKKDDLIEFDNYYFTKKKEWKKHNAVNIENEYTVFLPIENDDINIVSFNICLNLFDTLSAEEILKDRKESAKQSFEIYNEQFTVKSKNKNGDYYCRTILVKFDESTKLHKMISYFYFKNERTFIISGAAPIELFEDYKESMDIMFNSVVIKDIM